MAAYRWRWTMDVCRQLSLLSCQGGLLGVLETAYPTAPGADLKYRCRCRVRAQAADDLRVPDRKQEKSRRLHKESQ